MSEQQYPPVIPSLIVSDIQATLDWFGKLGYEMTRRTGGHMNPARGAGGMDRRRSLGRSAIMATGLRMVNLRWPRHPF